MKASLPFSYLQVWNESKITKCFQVQYVSSRSEYLGTEKIFGYKLFLTSCDWPYLHNMSKSKENSISATQWIIGLEEVMRNQLNRIKLVVMGKSILFQKDFLIFICVFSCTLQLISSGFLVTIFGSSDTYSVRQNDVTTSTCFCYWDGLCKFNFLA